MDGRVGAASATPAIGATVWCALFAAIHLFWAVGGTVGLASSAGHQLADQRPASFVIFGLYGVAVLLMAGIVVVIVGTRVTGSKRLSRLARLVMFGAAFVLLIRAIVLEVLLATDTGGLRSAVGPLETRWSLVLWNPWFALGGALFLWAALRARRSAYQNVNSSR